MKKFLFRTQTTMKEHNQKKWWIDSRYIGEKHIEADTVEEALVKYRELVKEKEYVVVSDNALKNKQPMFIDKADGQAMQIGYVITGQTEMMDDSNRITKQYVDLWVEIITIVETEF